jgi:hypothetical protein
MPSRDVIALYDRVHIGMHVTISEKTFDALLPRERPTLAKPRRLRLQEL